MDTREKLTEALEILEAMLSHPRCHKGALRVRDLVQLARDDLFNSEDDVAALGQAFPDDENIREMELDCDADPFPTA